MKRESIAYAISCTCFGILIGWVLGTQRAPAMPTAPASSQASTGQPREPEAPVLDEARAQELERLAAASPNDPAPRLALANLYHDAQRWELAAPAYELVLRLSPKNVDASTDLAACYYGAGQFDLALKQIDKSLAIDPKHLKSILNQGIIRAFGKGDLEGAAASWRKVIALAPQSAEAERAQQGLEAISGGGHGGAGAPGGRGGERP